VIIRPGNKDIAFRADQLFIPEKMITTGIAKPWKEKTDYIVP
jgi:hypothetical protein